MPCDCEIYFMFRICLLVSLRFSYSFRYFFFSPFLLRWYFCYRKVCIYKETKKKKTIIAFSNQKLNKPTCTCFYDIKANDVVMLMLNTSNKLLNIISFFIYFALMLTCALSALTQSFQQFCIFCHLYVDNTYLYWIFGQFFSFFLETFCLVGFLFIWSFKVRTESMIAMMK